MQNTPIMSETQANYSVKRLRVLPEAPFIFEVNPVSIEKEEAERNAIRQHNAQEIAVNAFIDWMKDEWECTWYASVCHYFTVCISLPENSWEICCKGDREEGGFFPKGTDLAFKKQYVQKQFNKVISKMNY